MSETTYTDNTAVTLKPGEFRQISDLAYERFGLDLKQGKEALVAARLGKKLRKGGFQSFSDYYRHVVSDATGEALIELIDSLSTNHTSFMRERAHFEFLVRAAAEEFRQVRTLEIWSAASSTGEEPYSIAMTLHDAFRAGGGKLERSFRIFATDISTRVLGIARRGVYEAERLRDLPESWRKAYFLRGQRDCSGYAKIKPELAAHVEFQRLNLIEPFTHGRRLQFIFCRNVMMYFDKARQQDIVQRLSECLEPGGYLFVGHSESLTGIQHDLKYARPAVYRKEKSAGGLRVWQ